MSLPQLLETTENLGSFAKLINTLPGLGQTRVVTGLHGSSDAVLVATLAKRLPTRLITIVTEQVADAERWLADLESVLDDPKAVAFYPPREGFGEVEPHAEVAGERVETLERAARGELQILITTARAVLEKTRLPRTLADARLEVRKGDVHRPEDLARHLESIGFERVDMVDDVAQFSVRGGIFDIYSFGMASPVRLEFWGDEISELRHFDLSTQRSVRDADVALILPVEGYQADGSEVDKLSGETMGFGVSPESLSTSDRVSILTLWPQDTIVVVPKEEHISPELNRTWKEAEHHIDLARKRGEDVQSRSHLYEEPSVIIKQLRSFGTISMAVQEEVADKNSSAIAFPFRAPMPINRDMQLLNQVARSMPTIILCDNAGQCERLEELLSVGSKASFPTLAIGVLAGGFIIGNELQVLTDHEIFRRERRIRRARRYATGSPIDTLNTLKAGDYIVHLEHGIGIYRGMQQMFVGDTTVEVIVIEYEGGDKLNVPLYKIDQIERYRASDDVTASSDVPPPRLHKLGGKRWAAQRDRTRSAIHEMTAELLELYARRKVATRSPHLPDTSWQKQLESSFLFEDTPDQRKATEDVKRDMEQQRPMDRLLVGDVGYGKTEIAVRAAFKAVQSGRQVAVLVPTTILAEQHARTFGDRLADFPMAVRTLSRFQTDKEQAQTLVEVAEKKADIVIGTHRLLSEDVKFADLGLIIIDEEHRFGVKHKERLKQLRLQTDVLTLTATPIPRTLHLSLAGLRDMTLMQTAPRDRSPVLTYVEPWDDALLDEGISRELDRGGQVFFVHNRVETIQGVADHIRGIVPRAKVGIGHGQMREKDLEEVMRKFVDHEIDILVSTMIVESGLDVPNANTMFVNRADTFGLAQLYQLRGRVGRSHRRAYCYLLAPDNMDEDAERRLKIMEHHTELGAGYRIALKDMELRGAGNLLGSEQSGFVHSVGFDMYLRMLDETVHRLVRGEDAPKLRPSEVSLEVPSYLPDDYIQSQDAKLDVYRRIAGMTEPSQLELLQGEIRDRFGPLPQPAQAFFSAALLRILGGKAEIESISVRGEEARINFQDYAVPQMKGISAAFHEVQFQAEVRRVRPLSLKLTRLGGASLLDGIVRALSTLATTASTQTK